MKDKTILNSAETQNQIYYMIHQNDKYFFLLYVGGVKVSPA